jgi:hypothetical protein
VKSRFTRSGIGPGLLGEVVVGRYGLGWGGDQVTLAHQLPHQLVADLLFLTNELRVHPAIAIRFVGQREDRGDEFCEVFAADRGGRGRPVSPFIVS